DLEAAQRAFRLSGDNPALKNMGAGRYGVMYRYPFRTLTFGGVAVNNPDLPLISRADSHIGEGTQLFLGIGIIRQLHMFISYQQRRIVVTAASAH
ncbi:MAG: hypothetical protein JO348_11685, partial [Alphaproteobacteria bacterium]|nr:hypothetical protein [Alphaproteobacteria bacterium]